MAFTKKEWKSGTVTKPAHVVIDGVEHEVIPAEVENGTPITPDELNRIEEGIEEGINAGGGDGILTGSVIEYEGDTIPEGYEEVEDDNKIIVVKNENGKAIKYPDGTMTCTKVFYLDAVPINTAIGNMYQSGDRELGNFAESFIDEYPVVNVNIRSSSSLGFLGYHTGVSKSSAGKIRINRPTSNDSNSYVISVTAYGNWK